MATASLSVLDPTVHQSTHNESIDSILSECGQFLGPHRHGLANPFGSFKIPTTASPKRSASLARHRSAESNKRHDHTLNRRSQYSSTAWGPSLESSHISLSGTEKRENKGYNAKESGGRRILNFLQRGFNTKRPKPINKGDIKKFPTRYLESSGSLNDLVCPNFDTSLSEAVTILSQQIHLPSSLLVALQCDRLCESRRQTVSISVAQQPTQITTVDSSLLDSDGRFCFQVICRRPSASSSTVNLPSSSRDPLSSSVNEGTPELLDVHTYACTSASERNRWMLYLKRLARPTRDSERRQESCLHVWIQEAKGLIGRHKYHCEILLDDKVYARTTSKRLTDMMFWGEEFDLSGVTKFSTLSVELWLDSDCPDASADSRGHRALSSPRQSSSPAFTRRTIMACAGGSDLAMNGELPTWEAEQANTDFSLSETQERKTNKGTEAAHNRKSVHRGGKTKRRSKRPTRSNLLATVVVPESKLREVTEVENWYPAALHESVSRLKRSIAVEPHSGGKRWSTKGQGNSFHDIDAPLQIRIKTRYRCVTVLPLMDYSRLQNRLTCFRPWQSMDRVSAANSTEASTDATVILSNLDPWLGVKAKSEIAGSVVALHQALGQATDFLAVLILHEVHKEPDLNMVLRGNSIATKATEIFLRLAGETYLSRILSEFVQIVMNGCNRTSPVEQPTKTAKQSRHTHATTASTETTVTDCEVDMAKVQNSTQLAQNQVNLMRLVDMVLNKILESGPYFPSQFRQLFSSVRKHLDDTFLACNTMNVLQATLSEHVISACLFLRYICPAILSPSLFGLVAEFPSDPKILRTFTLVAKTIQSLANFSLFAGSKESYMTFMNQYVVDQLPAMRHFLDAVSTPISTLSSELDSFRKSPQSTTRIFNSQSHHEGLLNSSMGQYDSVMNTSSILTGAVSGFSTTNTPVTSSFGLRPQTGDESRIISTAHSPQTRPVRQPMLLPSLPYSLPPVQFNDESLIPRAGEQVDLAVCLALCHLQLSEAVSRIPADKTASVVGNLKPMLEEIDYFLSSGIDPSPNWWRPVSLDNGFLGSQTSVNHVLVEQNIPLPSSQTTAPTLNDGSSRSPNQVSSVMNRSISAANSKQADRQRKSVLSADVNGLRNSCSRLPSYIIEKPVIVPKIVDQPTYEAKHSSVDNHENIDPTEMSTMSIDNQQQVCTVQTPYPLPIMPYKADHSEVDRPVTRPLNVSKVPSEESNMWSIGIETKIVSTNASTRDVYPSVGARDSCSQTTATTHPSFADISNSSGYHTLGSRENGKYDLINENHSSKYTGGHNITSSLSQSFNTPLTPSMNNPLYAIHGDASVQSSHSYSSQSSPSKDSVQYPSSMVQAVAVRSSPSVSHKLGRRHTYVNMNGHPPVIEPRTTITRGVRLDPSPDDDFFVNQSLERFSETPNSSDLDPKHPTNVSHTDILEYDRRGLRVPHVDRPNQPATLYDIFDRYDIRPFRTGTDSVRSAGYGVPKRTNIFLSEFKTAVSSSIRDELDASQARLAEAQARLLANEAERIQLLRAWHNELMHQSQLVTQVTAQQAVSDHSCSQHVYSHRTDSTGQPCTSIEEHVQPVDFESPTMGAASGSTEQSQVTSPTPQR